MAARGACAASGAPVIGFLNGQSPQALAPQVAAFRQALNEAGYVDGQNVAIEYHWGRDDQLDCRLSQLIPFGVKSP